MKKKFKSKQEFRKFIDTEFKLLTKKSRDNMYSKILKEYEKELDLKKWPQKEIND